jgi:two-component system cell cycle response regulator DivK
MPNLLNANSIENTNAQATLRQLPNKPKVLIVEDHDDTREMLRILLEMKSCHVVEACNGQEAIEVANREQPDLILMDGSLPLLDGLEATRRIRENVGLREVLILALNGWGTPSFHAAALAAGCDDCMTKPIDFEELERHMAPLFDRNAVARVQTAW